jgi:dodecin
MTPCYTLLSLPAGIDAGLAGIKRFQAARRIMSAPFSPMMAVALVLPDTTVGMIEASMRRGHPGAPPSRFADGAAVLASCRRPHFPTEANMPIVRNIDVTMQSEVSFDDACRLAVAEAAKTLRGIMSFRIKEAECVVEHDKIIAFRVTGKIVFLVER